jgi:hypothetical protein
VIEKLTPEQELKVIEYVNNYTNIGVDTKEVDRTVVHEINELYRMMDTPSPKYIWVDNPWEANIVLSAMASGKDFPELDDEIDNGELINRDIIEKVASKINKHNFNYNIGNLNAYWLAYLNFGREVLDINYDYKEYEPIILDVWTRLISKCGVFFPLTNVCVVCNRPQEVYFDDNRELHREDGPAISFRRGTECDVYSFRGVTVNEKIIMRPETLTIEDFHKEKNAEVRRIVIERMGTDKYLEETNAKLIDADTTFTDYIGGVGVPRALMEDNEGRRFLVASDGGTGRVYYMQVPKECNTCGEASDALAGKHLNESDIIAVG